MTDHICRNCQLYTENHYCRIDQKRKKVTFTCNKFRIRLADHYVPNMWDEWKRNAERQQVKKKG